MSRSSTLSTPAPHGTLSFAATGGPLLAFAGLCGGAGASTLTYLTAVAAARASSVPVLACDTGGPTGGLALYAGVEAPQSLTAAAERLAAGQPLAGSLFASTSEGLRLIASGPEFLCAGEPRALARVLGDAQRAHGLTVVDCGTLARASERDALGLATHIAWVLPATLSGTRRAQRVLDVVHPYLPGNELLVARFDPAGRKAPMRELTELADSRMAPLVLVPHLPDLGESPIEEALDACEVALEAIGTVLRR